MKSDEIIELLELSDVDVVYSFDRLHENMPDEYWASFLAEGFELKFDEHQKLKCIFLYVLAKDGFSPADLSGSDLQIFESCSDVTRYAAQNQLAVSEGQASWQGVDLDWVKIELDSYFIHYEYQDGNLRLITLMVA